MTILARYTLTEAHFRIADLERELADTQWERDNYATVLKFARLDRDALRKSLRAAEFESAQWQTKFQNEKYLRDRER